ncbi:MAG: type pantothenate kinase [Fimbriimonadaceae bacterium]|jgi:type III pantothenate kinase|nr:type pantothenate kinase [Fimbriimonadaceae bacterium]
MLLAIDVGNTDTKAGVWDGKHWVRFFRTPTQKGKQAPKFIDLLGNFHLERAICASVVPAANRELSSALKRAAALDLTFLSADAVNFNIDYKTPETLGADRLANALAVSALSPHAIAVDVGTATKLEAVLGGTYLGGAILPGLEMVASALGKETAQLPVVELSAPKKAIGVDTSSAIRSGVMHGHASAIDGMIARFAREMAAKPDVFITGGHAELIKPLCLTSMTFISHLTLDGLVEGAKRLR